MSVAPLAETSLLHCHRLCVHSLTITNFRSYSSLSLDVGGKPVVLTGENGAGKTNLLEAISLLVPGRGLRNAKLVQLRKQPVVPEEGWGVAAKVETAGGVVDFGTGQQPGREDKRILKLEGELLKSQAELGQHFAVLWQTPQMDGLFVQSHTERRHYYDRICSVFAPNHTAQIAKYDYLRRERAKLLAMPNADGTWLTSIERKMAECSLAIAATRLEILEILNHAIERLHPAFPKAQLELNGFAEMALLEGKLPALELEEQLLAILLESRREDKQSGRASHGAHKMELKVVFAPKGTEAVYCSTGEQKVLMLSLLLAQARAIKEHQNRLPILLLDEAVSHLDESRRIALFETIAELGSQVWMTGTDKELFAQMPGAQHYKVEDSAVIAEG